MCFSLHLFCLGFTEPLNLWVYSFLQIGSTQPLFFSTSSDTLDLHILACGIPELWHDSSTLKRPHCIGFSSRHCRAWRIRKEMASGSMLRQLVWLACFLPPYLRTSPMLPVVQCVKTVVSYILSSFLVPIIPSLQETEPF